MAILVPTKPKAVNVAFVAAESFSDVLEVVKTAKRTLGEILSACEFLDHASMELTVKNLGLRNPLGAQYPFYMLLETHGSNNEHDEEKLQSCLEEVGRMQERRRLAPCCEHLPLCGVDVPYHFPALR